MCHNYLFNKKYAYCLLETLCYQLYKKRMFVCLCAIIFIIFIGCPLLSLETLQENIVRHICFECDPKSTPICVPVLNAYICFLRLSI